MKKLKFEFFFLIAVICLAFFLRIFDINQIPSRLTHDEMSIGYNAYSILKTGKDEWGRAFPLSFEAFGDHKLPGYIYAAVPFIAIFGLTPLGVKAVSIISGTLLVLGIYLFVKFVSKNVRTAQIAAVTVALAPWAIHISRMAFESNLALVLFVFGLTTTLLSWQKKSYRFALLAGLFFSLSLYSYVAYRLIVVALLAVGFVLVLFERNATKIKIYITTLVSFGILSLPLAVVMFGTAGTARFSQVSIINDPGIVAEATEKQNFCFLTRKPFLPIICRYLYSKEVLMVNATVKNYAKVIFPTFIFVEGDKLEYLNIPHSGEFLLIFAPFYLYGLVIFIQSKNKYKKFVLAAFLLAPVPVSLTGDPQIVRASAVLPFIALFTSMGVSAFISYLGSSKIRYAILGLFWAGVLGLFLFYYLDYLYIYSNNYEEYVYPFPPEAAIFLEEAAPQFDQVYITNAFPDAHISIAFYQKIDPAWYQENIVRPKADGFGFKHPTQLGNYYFGDAELTKFWCVVDVRTLYVSRNLRESPTWSFKDFSGVHTQAQLFDAAKCGQSD